MVRKVIIHFKNNMLVNSVHFECLSVIIKVIDKHNLIVSYCLFIWCGIMVVYSYVHTPVHGNMTKHKQLEHVHIHAWDYDVLCTHNIKFWTFRWMLMFVSCGKKCSTNSWFAFYIWYRYYTNCTTSTQQSHEIPT